MGHAFNIRLEDTSIHAYAQQYCFAHGPDPERNAILREAVIRSVIPQEEEHDSTLIEMIPLSVLRAGEKEFSDVEVPSTWDVDLDHWRRDLHWKVSAVPKSACNILVLGSSSCREAVFLRHHLPDAEITLTDFRDYRLPEVEARYRVHFHQGNFNELLENNPETYDAVFSNHVLEHLYNPEATLSATRRALKQDGVLIAALPLEGAPCTPFSDMLSHEDLHPLDFGKVDIAHAWKTNVTGLRSALCRAGFELMRFSQRDGYFSFGETVYPSRDAFERRARLGMMLNTLLLEPPKTVLRHLFPRHVPRTVLRAVFGIEARLWFGSNQLKNHFAPECLVIAS